ncbi:MAG: 1-acyl-sn-glycerol-3-phosphate acyltransferase, partial [Clostridia bacterium]|nr:1-acyl-sn-glycerol-3-phosphate acyltransferase [Clostridia bacterium]
VLFWILGSVAALILCCVILVVVSSLFVKEVDYDKNSRFYRFILYSATALAVFFSRVTIKVEGAEKMPSDGRFLLVSNHRSKYDPIITWHVFRKSDLAFISKPENFKEPFFGKIIRKCCFMPIDRENPRNALKTLKRAIELIKADEVSVGVYPEGTRSRTCELLPFSDGLFSIAQKASVPTVVVTVEGTEMISKNFPLKRTYVTLSVLDVLSPDETVGHRTGEIGKKVRDMMLEKLGK